MNNTELVVIGKNELALGGQGINFADELFQPKCANLKINQRMTSAEGAVPGMLRIAETNQQFESMDVLLLEMPTKARSYNVGEVPSADTIICYSRDMRFPHKDAKVPQAMQCFGCPRADWTKWQETKNIKDAPPCQEYYRAVFIDTVYKMPLQMYVKGGSISTFKAGMGNLARVFAMMKSQGLNPNIFDVRFKLSTEKGKKGTNFVLKVSDPVAITEVERAEFGDIYLNYINRGRKTEEELCAEEVAEQETELNNQLTKPNPSDKLVITDDDIPF